MYFVHSNGDFPDLKYCNSEGFLAFSEVIDSQLLYKAYYNGIFPWSKYLDFYTWWSPDPRMVLFTNEIKISKSMRKIVADPPFKITYNTAFKEVMSNCAKSNRGDDQGTWIEDEMIEQYYQLHLQGRAQSVEVWNSKNELIGGLYGVSIGKMFFGESMFSKVANTSKLALISLCRELSAQGCQIVDCQMYTQHLASMGAREIPRDQYVSILKQFRNLPDIRL